VTTLLINLGRGRYAWVTLLPMVFVCRVADGFVTHERRIYDFTGMLVQLGVLKAKPA